VRLPFAGRLKHCPDQWVTPARSALVRRAGAIKSCRCADETAAKLPSRIYARRTACSARTPRACLGAPIDHEEASYCSRRLPQRYRSVAGLSMKLCIRCAHQVSNHWPASPRPRRDSRKATNKERATGASIAPQGAQKCSPPKKSKSDFFQIEKRSSKAGHRHY